MPIYHDSRQGIQANNVWNGEIRFRCPWANPMWQDYVLQVFDLTQPADVGPPVKSHADATHEFHLWACDPDVPLNRGAPEADRKSRFLTPQNMAYQFKAKSNEEAWSRVNTLVYLCMTGNLSPDTDWRSAWDEHMIDGWTLVRA